ncbi:MAG: hypothetical protein LUC31_03150 [Coprobacillus sp.]|nr:hypothetical protein [Coprobacillus sp.]
MEKININIDELGIKRDTKQIASMKAFIKKHEKEVPLPANLDEKLLDEYIYSVYDYVCDHLICSKCPGIEKCSKESFVTSNIKVHSGVVEELFIPCQQILKLTTLNTRYILRDYPQEWDILDIKTGNLDTSKKRYDAIQRAYFDRKSTYIQGAENTGKSYLATAITNEIAKDGVDKICYLDSVYRINEMNKASEEEREEMIKRYSRCNLLVLDNFGEEFANDYIRDQIIKKIIKFRNERQLETIYVSKFSFNELFEHYITVSKDSRYKAKDLVDLIALDCDHEIVVSNLAGLYEEKS